MHPRSLKSDALVAGSIRLSEADRIVTLYTRERGRVSAVAKGVRRTRSKIGGRLEPFSLVHVVLYPGRSLYTITSVETLRTFQGIRDELFRMEEGGSLLHDLRRMFPEEEQNVGAFNLLVRGFARLASAPDRESAARIILAARLKLLLALGYLPELDTCVLCGGGEFLCAFNPSRGGVICADCLGEGREDCFSLSAEGMKSIREFLERPLSEADRVDAPKEVLAEIERVRERTLSFHGH